MTQARLPGNRPPAFDACKFKGRKTVTRAQGSRPQAAVAISPQAAKLEELLKQAPKQIDLPLPQKRAAGEHAEDLSSEPEDVAYEDAPEVGGLWAKPAGAREDAVIMYLFGGGYTISSPHSRRKFAGHLARAAGTRALVPDYALAPEHPFPGAIESALSAYRFLLDGGFAAGRIFVGGDSSGGGLAAATLLASKREGLPLPGGAVALSPWADLAFTGRTFEPLAAVDLTVTKDGLERMAADYLAGADPRDPLASPIFGDFSGLPPLLIVVGGYEGLLDDAVNLARQAAIGGVDVSLRVFAGMQHVFPIYAGFLPEADAAIALLGSWIRARLEAR
jgi:epsilon-lactone hydrolase